MFSPVISIGKEKREKETPYENLLSMYGAMK